MNTLPPQSGNLGTAEDSVVPNFWAVRGRHLAGWAAKIVEFGLIQGLVQFILAVSGLLIVRSLPKSEYAIFAIANSIQVTCNALADLGIGIGIRSIGGQVYADPRRFGSLLKAALSLRYRFALGSLAACIPVAIWMLVRNGASLPLTIGLSLMITASVIPLLGYAVWNTSVQLHGQYRRIQKLDLGNSVLRLGIIALLYSRLNALLALSASVATNWVQWFFMRRWGREHVDVDVPPDAEYRKELIRLSVRSLPNTVFFCFQGQVTLLILTFAGNSTGIADITALGRIAAVFAVLASLLSNLLGPRFARCQDPHRIPRLYALLVGGTVLVLTPLVVVAGLAPGPFLWLLGSKYAGLEHECLLVIGAACLAHIGNTMWNLNSSKAWISVQVRAYIPVMIGAQVLAIALLDVRKFHDVLLFNLVVSAVPILTYSLDAWRGMRSLKASGSPPGASSKST
jgi:hypothetical protein